MRSNREKKETADAKLAEKQNEKGEKTKEQENTSANKNTPTSGSPETDKTPGEDKPEDSTKPSPEKRFLFYNPLKLKLIATLKQISDNEEKNANQIHLGDQIKVELEIVHEGEAKPNFQIDENFKVVIVDETVVESPTTTVSISYFEAEEEIIFDKDKSRDTSPAGSKQSPDWKSEGDGKWHWPIKPERVLSPKIDAITNKKCKPEYPITFAVKRSTGILSESGEKILKQLAKCRKTVTVLPPIITMTRTKRRLPLKGEQFDIRFNIECKAMRDHNSKRRLTIPLTLKGYFGKAPKQDFEVVGSEPEKINNTSTGYYNKEFSIEANGNAEKITFTLLATKASFRGYYGIANFKLEVPNWEKTISEWRETMIILPNRVDTIVAGVTTLLGIFYIYRPDFFPFIPGIPSLNIANLEAIPAVVYLGYRVFNWARGTSSKASSGA